MVQKLQNKIPVFPLRGAVFFPQTNLPLNIFEDRYLKMVENAIKGNGVIGMVQSKEVDGEVFKVGCLGEINNHQKTEDGRILINLRGLTRFNIDKEINNHQPFREFFVNYDVFKKDIEKNHSIGEELFQNLIDNSKKLFDYQGSTLNWKEFSKLKKLQQVYTLIMISPFSVSEKQKLLETPEIQDIVKVFIELTNFAFHQGLNEDSKIQ